MLFILSVTMISAKASMNETGRPGIPTGTAPRKICGSIKKTCPEESLIQIGTMEKSVSPAVLAEIAPQQEKALEALGFDLPNPDQRPGKLNNRKMTFDAACRTMLFDICKRHGLHLDQEPEYGGRAYLEKQDYILMKQKEKLAVQDQQIEAKEAELEVITIRIFDTEAFVEEVADVAYEKAVEAVTDTIWEEVRNEDFEIIANTRESLFRSYKFTPDAAQLIEAVFSDIMDRFKGMTQHISERLASIFRSPKKKSEIKEPIKESIRDRLARSQKRADDLNARRRAERGMPPKRKQQNMDL